MSLNIFCLCLLVNVYFISSADFQERANSSELIIVHSPACLTFQKSAAGLLISDIPNVLALSFGLNINEPLKWDGLLAGSLFKRPKASVVFSVYGVNPDLLILPVHMKYDVLNDVNLDTEYVSNSLQEVFNNPSPLTVDFSLENMVFDIRSHYPSLLANIPHTMDKLRNVFMDNPTTLDKLSKYIGSINASYDDDLAFLGELYVVRELVKALKSQQIYSNDASPDFFHFKISSSLKLGAIYGRESTKFSDVLLLLQAFIAEVTEDFKELYAGNVLIKLITIPQLDNVKGRKGRSLLQTRASPEAIPASIHNSLSNDFDDNYPVIFNIMLWGMISLAIAVYGIAWSIWFMDPGRDSIIYRMTTQRMKKD